MFNYLKNKEIKLDKFIESTKNFLSEKFGTKDRTFSYSNPLGQLLLVVKNISRVNLFYIKDASNQTNFKHANRIHSVQGLAQLQGHNAFRGYSAKSVIKLELKDSFNPSTIKGNYIYFPDRLKMKCKNNDLEYCFKIGKDFDKVNVSNMNQLSYMITQGGYKFAEFASDGRNLQTYSVTINPDEIIDHEDVLVEVNGVKYTKYESMRDALFMDRFVMVKTGISGGIDIIFGKDTSHTIPKNGETISVTYLIHKGIMGNIEKPIFSFIDPAYDELGNEINLNEVYNIQCVDDRTYFGANPEDMELTKIIAPNITPNSIIHDKKSLTYHIQMMNMFSNIKITKENSTLNAILYPRIRDLVSDGEDYFSMDINKILLSKVEKERLLERMNNKQSNSIEIVIKNPKLVKFGANIMVEAFSSHNITEETVATEVRKVCNDYMLSLKRMNKVADSDLTKLIDNLPFVDTVKVEFIVQDEEQMDRFGNVLLDEEEVAVMRGGFTDYNGNYVDDSFDKESTYSFVNIDVHWI